MSTSARILQDNGKPAVQADDQGWIRGLTLVIVVGVVGLVGFAGWSAAEFSWSGVAAALLLAGACLLVGALIGFLFGIPRALQQEDAREDGSAAGTSSYRANTNLEQISDWLTKILVGVGLTQLAEIPAALTKAGEHLGGAFTGSAAAAEVASVAIVYFLTSGFLFSYLWTRLFLLGLLTRADLGAVLTQIATQQERDVDAYGLIYQYLQPDAPEVEEDALKRAIRESSPTIRQQIFTLAKDFRRDNWKNQITKPVLLRTIPVFRALIEAAGARPPHEYFGQLAYSLKDQPVPDWQAARDELTRAIKLRGRWQDFGWVTYEANRAECLIELDEKSKSGQPSDKDVRELIIADLTAASSWDYTRDWLERPPYSGWMSLNQVDEDQLAGS